MRQECDGPETIPDHLPDWADSPEKRILDAWPSGPSLEHRPLTNGSTGIPSAARHRDAAWQGPCPAVMRNNGHGQTTTPTRTPSQCRGWMRR